MSLFPAYAQQEEASTSTKQDWLENSSFKPDIALLNNNGTQTEAPKAKKKKSKRKKRRRKSLEIQSDSSNDIEKSSDSDIEAFEKRKRRHPKEDDKMEIDIDQVTEEFFKIDLKPTKEFLNVATISRPSVAKYNKYYLDKSFKQKKQKTKRYFQTVNSQDKSEDDECKKLTREILNKLDASANKSAKDENFPGSTEEENLSKTTAHYNKNLTDNPKDIQMWLKYVDFQNTVYEFEKSYKKGSIAKAQRVLAERKISILDKALIHNPGCEELLRKRLDVAVTAFPADELQTQLKKLLEKEKDNIILWQGYIEATQCSMSHCNSPAVLNLYIKCLSSLHQLRRSTLSEKSAFEESILKILYQCGLFLKQAGLFEQLWTVLKLYLELNLNSTKGEFNVEKYFKENELLELEDVVLKSKLPHHELWLRTEKLRESCHWLPLTGGECEDPQRLVFNADVAELIQPITIKENIFRLVATCLTLLKIPLLPSRHATMQDLGLDYVPWSLDSIEMLLPVFVPLYPVDTLNKNLLKDTDRLAVGPQYLKVLPGQEEYLNFVLSVMEGCAECLEGKDQIAVRIWWFRFLRLLIILDIQKRFKLPSNFKKQIKSSIKDLLKREQFRNNEMFYMEYALIEKALGNCEKSINILKTALNMNQNKSIVTENSSESQTNQCNLYKNLIEVLMDSTNSTKTKENVLNELLKLVLQRKFDSLTNGLLMEAETKFKNITEKLLQRDISDLSSRDHFLADFFTDWIICHGWFLYWTKGPLQCGKFIEDTLLNLENRQQSLNFQKEILYEFHCSVLFKSCMEPGTHNFKILDEVLFKAIEKYPNNLYLLSILAKEQSLKKNFGMSAWKVQDLLLKTGRSIATIFVIIINDLVQLEIEAHAVDSSTGLKLEMDSNFKNKTNSLFKKITNKEMCTRRCGLVWRLFLQFVHQYFDTNVCRNVYYSAVEQCPWLKALYMDAAIYIPAELAQIQDLIIEKQLRLHLTPEELDILRI
ncbi:unnamed protein product [Ceutorhynchus assimilis]|uniref:Protein NRDE2 homolog n=1 Tax=Ceutorhynchus assimilis TaxID=467358 RepID=A0A9N9MWK6_9CUCU|nr:unnamed protein product [Ceutorhynchus assimilis]